MMLETCSRLKLMASELPAASEKLQEIIYKLKAELKELDKLIAEEAASEPNLLSRKSS